MKCSVALARFRREQMASTRAAEILEPSQFGQKQLEDFHFAEAYPGG